MTNTYLTLKKITLATFATTVAVSIFFVIFPQLDLFVSSLFADQTGQFPIAESDIANMLRDSLIYGMWLFVFSALLFFSCSIILGGARIVPLRIWAYPVVVSIVGPLILVNAILKNNWGRARPHSITEFGGAMDFTPAYYLSDQCLTNCSFTSGEGAAIATVTIVTGILLWHSVRHKLLLSVLIPLFILGAGLRVAKGMHFISDTLLSALFCALVAIFFYWLMNIGDIRDKLTWQNAKRDFLNLGKFHPRFGNRPKK